MMRHLLRLVLSLCLVALATYHARAADPDAYRVLPVKKSRNDPRNALRKYLLSQAKLHFDARRKAVEQITTVEALEQRRQYVRQKLLKINGPFPEKTPLNAQLTGVIECDGYTIEKVIFESQPRHHVTAHLYLPTDREGPVPGVLSPCGHSGSGKTYPPYQRMCISLSAARHPRRLHHPGILWSLH